MPGQIVQVRQKSSSPVLGMLGAAPEDFADLPDSVQAAVNNAVVQAAGDAPVETCQAVAKAAAVESYSAGWMRGAAIAGIIALLLGGALGYFGGSMMTKRAIEGRKNRHSPEGDDASAYDGDDDDDGAQTAIASLPPSKKNKKSKKSGGSSLSAKGA